MHRSARSLAIIVFGILTLVDATAGAQGDDKHKPKAKAKPGVSKEQRLAAIRRAQVWIPTDIPSMNLRQGPLGKGSFAPEELVTCDYIEKAMEGNSPKFTCVLPGDDDVKVKYGRSNGEVFGEVATTRLLWALGFGADRMYPVRVECHGCPPEFKGAPRKGGAPVLVEPATIERKMSGHAIETKDNSGWSWPELDLVDARAGGATRAQIDGLRLLASLLQHTDSKPAQQRLLCLPDEEKHKTNPAECAAPMMMLNDVGLTFGHANTFNRNGPGSVNFEEWSKTPVWKDSSGCVGNISKSMTGTLEHPAISEAGRAFLAGLLAQLSDAQLHDLFDVSRFALRSGHSTDEWVAAFKRKRAEVADRSCTR